MGYTHYYTDLILDSALSHVSSKIVETAEKDFQIELRHGNGYDDPVVMDTYLSINGNGDKSLECESFTLVSDEPFSYQMCKTARLPYDQVVSAILVAAIDLKSPGYRSIRSDGNLLEWMDGLELYEQAAGKKIGDDTAEYLALSIGVPDMKGLFDPFVWNREALFMATMYCGIGQTLAFSAFIVKRELGVTDVDITQWQRYWDMLGAGVFLFHDLNCLRQIVLARDVTDALASIWSNYLSCLPERDFKIEDEKEFFATMKAVGEEVNVRSACSALLEGVPVSDIVA